MEKVIGLTLREEIKMNKWYDILKGKRITSIGIKAFDAVMADRQERTMSTILSEIQKWMQENRPKSAQAYTPTRGQLSQHISKRRDIQREEKRKDVVFYRKV